jgi:hypothetical protein
MNTEENRNSVVAFYNEVLSTKNPQSALNDLLCRALSKARQTDR